MTELPRGAPPEGPRSPSPHVIRAAGRYAIYDEIAQGGTATVHLGRLRGAAGFARIVAVKRLHPQLARDPELVQMFTDEARLAARIAHPNVVPALDVVSTDGELFLVMDYVSGETLARLIVACRRAGERVPAAIASSILCGALHGLHAAHEAMSARGEPLDIVHRDVSPQNILVGADGSARVLDFGIAKAAGKLSRTEAGVVKGKAGYMSPEQLYGERLDRRTDIYAAGVVLWETLVCERLFAGSGDEPAMAKMLSSEVEPPSRRVASLPPALDEVVLRAVSRDRARRFATAHEMALALERAAPPATAPEVSAWVRSRAGEAIAGRARLIAELEKHADRNDDEFNSFSGVTSPSASTAVAPAISAATASSPMAATTPTSATSSAPRSRKTRAALVASIVVFVVLVGGLAARSLLFGSSATPREEAPNLISTSGLPTAPTSAAPERTAEEPPKAPPPMSEAAPRPIATTEAAPPASGARVAAPKPIKTPRLSCDPPYTIEANGHKRYKRECLR